MAQIRIDQLPLAGALSGAELLVLEQVGVTVQGTVAAVVGLTAPAIAAEALARANADTALANAIAALAATIPGNIDWSGVSADTALAVGVTAVLPVAGLASVPLYVLVGAGQLYEIGFSGHTLPYPTVGGSVLLQVNNLPVSPAVQNIYGFYSKETGVPSSWTGITAVNGSFGGASGFLLAADFNPDNFSAKVDIGLQQVTADYRRLDTGYVSGILTRGSIVGQSVAAPATPYVWTSLGTILFAEATSGTLYITRKA